MDFLTNFWTSIKDMNGYQWGFVAITNLTTGLVTWNRTCAYHDVGYYAPENEAEREKEALAEKKKNLREQIVALNRERANLELAPAMKGKSVDELKALRKNLKEGNKELKKARR